MFHLLQSNQSKGELKQLSLSGPAFQFFQTSGPKILEIGCGTGQYTTKLAEQGYQITAVDISEEMMAVAREKITNLGYEAKWLKADITLIMDQLEQYQGILSMSATLVD